MQTDSAFADERHKESIRLFAEAEYTKNRELYLRAARLEESLLEDLGNAVMVLGPIAVSAATCYFQADEVLDADRIARAYVNRVQDPWREMLRAWITDAQA